MKSWSDNLKTFFYILVSAVLLGAGALLASPILTKNIKFLAVLPVAVVFFMIMVLNFKTMFIFIILSRDFLDPILSGTKIGEGGGIGGVLNVFVIMMVVVTMFKHPHLVKSNRFLRPWAFFLIFTGCSVLYAPVPGNAVKLLLNFATYACIFWVPFLLINTEKDKKFWIKLIMIASLVPVAFANIGIFYKHPMLYSWGRLQSTFTHSNILAFYMVLVITISFVILRTRLFKLTPMWRLLLWCYVANLTAILIITQTRSAWISFALLFLIYGVMKERKLLIVCFFAGALMFSLPAVQERIKDLGEGTGVTTNEKLNSMAWRMKLWESAMPSIQNKLILGHGLGSFQPLSKEFFSLESQGAPAHNVYIELIFETGILGLISYLMIFITLLRVFFHRIRALSNEASKESAILFAYILGYMAVCFTDNALYYLAFNWYFWFFAGVILRSRMLEPVKTTVDTEEVGT